MGSSPADHTPASLWQCKQLALWRERYQRRVCLGMAVLAVLCAALTSYYLYLANLYLVDEAYSVDRLRELTIDEKLTIKVSAPGDARSLSAFILHYSICPAVHEIQVVWTQKTSPPAADSFKYTTTHSKVTFLELDGEEQAMFRAHFHPQLSTASALLLDADVFVSCQDLVFVQSVWRSSQVSAVGFFPRHVQESRDRAGKVSFSLDRPSALVWQQEYSLLLSAGVMVGSGFVQSLADSKEMAQFASQRPHCAEMVLPVWLARNGAQAPIWADVTPSIASGVQLMGYPLTSTKQRLGHIRRLDTAVNITAHAISGAQRYFSIPHKPDTSYAERSACITEAAQALGVDHLPKSHARKWQKYALALLNDATIIQLHVA